MKTIYCLRIRWGDDQPWSDTEYYQTRKERDGVERLNRCMGGIRTHSSEERKSPEEIEDLLS